MDALIRFPVIKKLEIFFKNPQQDLSSWIPHTFFSAFGVVLLFFLLSLPKKDLMHVYEWYFILKSALTINEIFGINGDPQKLSISVLEFIFNFFCLLLTNADRYKCKEINLIFFFLMSIFDPEILKISYNVPQTFFICAQIAFSSVHLVSWVKSVRNYDITGKEFWDNVLAKCDIKQIANAFYYYYFFQLTFLWILDIHFLSGNTWWYSPPFHNYTDFQEWIFKAYRTNIISRFDFSEWNFTQYFNLMFDEPNKVFGLLAFACFLTNSTCKYFQSYLNIPFTIDDLLRLSAKSTAAIFFMAVDDRLWSLPCHSVWWKVFPLYVFIHTSYFLLEFTETAIKSVWRRPKVRTKRQQRRIEEAVCHILRTSFYLFIVSWSLYLIPWDFYPSISAPLLISLNLIRTCCAVVFHIFKHMNSKVAPLNRHDNRHRRRENLELLEALINAMFLDFSTVFVLWMAISGSYWLFALHAFFGMGRRLVVLRKRYLYHVSWVMVGNVKPPLPETSETDSKADDDMCLICHDEISSTCVVTRCCHLYHSQCLTPWVAISDTCPLCGHLIFKKEMFEGKLDMCVFVRETFNSEISCC